MRNCRRPKLTRCDVVRIDSPVVLSGADHPLSWRKTADGKPLAVGYYLLLSSAGDDPYLRPRAFRYFGPFATEGEARLLQITALALGIAESEVAEEPWPDHRLPALSCRQMPHSSAGGRPPMIRGEAAIY